MKSDDIYAIIGRVKNIVANKGIALSPAGTILVNSYVLVLKELQDFAQTLPEPYASTLQALVVSKEGLPEYVIRLTSPKKEPMSLYDEVVAAMENPQFKTNKEALEHFQKEYDDLGKKYGMTGDEFWLEAEELYQTEDHRRIMKLSRSIQMVKYLIKKYE